MRTYFMCAYVYVHRDPTHVQAQASSAGGILKVIVDGRTVELELGKQFFTSASARAQALGQ